MSFGHVSRNLRRALERENARQPARLAEVPRSEWPSALPPRIERVWRSQRFLVQQFTTDHAGVVRLSICRTSITGDRWADGITWDELQALKRECGFGDRDAVEVYPPDRDVVNVANMRHLWVLEQPLSFAWRNCST